MTNVTNSNEKTICIFFTYSGRGRIFAHRNEKKTLSAVQKILVVIGSRTKPIKINKPCAMYVIDVPRKKRLSKIFHKKECQCNHGVKWYDDKCNLTINFYCYSYFRWIMFMMLGLRKI